MAHLSQDEGLLNAFANELDVHSATAAEVFGVEIGGLRGPAAQSEGDQFWSDLRDVGLWFGQQLGLAGMRRRSTSICTLPGTPGWQITWRGPAIAHDTGYVETLRVAASICQRSTPRIDSASKRLNARRSMRLQGTAADMIKMAMLAVDGGSQAPIDARMIMQVHDELVFEVEASAVDELCETVGRLMSESGCSMCRCSSRRARATTGTKPTDWL